MIGYASRTGTKRNLDALRSHGWRLLVSATGVHRTEGFLYGIDNGAWTAFQKGEPFNVPAFEAVVEKLGAGADWIVIPDIVCGGRESLAFSCMWLDRLRGIAPLLLAVQPGVPVEAAREIAQDGFGIFVGGDTEWKEASLPIWGQLADETGCYLHVGRVNSRRRIKLCALAGADSFDGTSVSKYAVTIHRLDAELRQQTLWNKGET